MVTVIWLSMGITAMTFPENVSSSSFPSGGNLVLPSYGILGKYLETFLPSQQRRSHAAYSAEPREAAKPAIHGTSPYNKEPYRFNMPTVSRVRKISIKGFRNS